jgi:hypothetical protein
LALLQPIIIVWMDRSLCRTHMRKLLEYYRVLNSADDSGWERAFDETWHPDGRIEGRNIAAIKDLHRQRLESGYIENVHVLGSIDANRIEFSTEVCGQYAGPFVATFRDGRIYRVL